MNKAELVAKLAESTNNTKKSAEEFLNAFMETVNGELKKGGTIQLVGFGTFKVAQRAARKGRNPKTGKEITIPATKYPKFIPGKGLKENCK